MGPERIIFAPLAQRLDHLRRLRAADVFADTHPYSAHTVGCDALWAGVPIVTLAGDTMASRVAASLLHTAKLGELVATDSDKYFVKLRRLCVDPIARQRARDGVERARAHSPLFDTHRWVRDVERGLERVWELHSKGYSPQDVCIEELPGEADGQECCREGYTAETSAATVYKASNQEKVGKSGGCFHEESRQQ